jgi:CelD/BcsL family acetyltransferase involved in cellulose biosynthesis
VSTEVKTRRGTLDTLAHASEQPGASTPVKTQGESSSPKRQMTVVVVKDVATLESHIPAWEKLVHAVVESNVFYEPWMVMPALRAYGTGKNLQFVLIFAPDPTKPAGPPLLCGVFPLEVQRRYVGLATKLPIKTLSLWRHPRCYLCIPLLRTDYAHETLSEFFDWLAGGTHGCTLMEFGSITGDGRFHQILVDYFYEHPKLTCITERFTRALFRPADKAENYLNAAVSSKHRRVLRRQERLLAENGRLEYVAIGPEDNIADWIQQFLKLEASGWKGQEGSAFALNETDRGFFSTITEEAFNRGQLTIFALCLDAKPIALKCNLHSGPGSFAFRIAFNEDYARFSPGALLELDNIRRLHVQPGLRWMDSCAEPDHFMKNWLWLDRRTIATIVVGTGRGPGDLVVALIPLIRWLKRRLFFRRVKAASPKTSATPAVSN